MPRVRVKICGITNVEDAFLAVEQGADALGFIFADSPRRVDVPTARRIVGQLPPFVATVGVFRDHSLNEVRRTMDQVRLNYAQLHGSEPCDYLQQLNGRAIKVFHLDGPEVLQQIRRCGVTTFVLDVPKGWRVSVLDEVDIARRAAREGRLILAGGLTPENVKQAIQEIRPFAVDVASGVEAYPGKKSEEQLIEFFRCVREASYDLSTTR